MGATRYGSLDTAAGEVGGRRHWGCYTFAEAEYSNPYELSAGITLRF